MNKTPSKLTKKEDLEDARTKYNAVLSLKASEGDIQWNRYNAMLVVNTIIIGFIGFAYNKDFNFPLFFRVLFWFTPLLGFLLSIAWYRMTNRGFEWTEFWSEKANEIENQISGDINPLIEGKDKRDKMGKGLTKNASLNIIKFFAAIYILIFFSNILSLCSGYMLIFYQY